jgi:hypothetical protein
MENKSPKRVLVFTILLSVFGVILSDPFLTNINSKLTQTLFVLPFLIYSFSKYSAPAKSQFIKLVLIYNCIVLLFFAVYGFNNIELLSNLFGTSLLGIAIYNIRLRNYIFKYCLKFFVFGTTIFCLSFYLNFWEVSSAGRATFISHNENFLGQLLCTSFAFLIYFFKTESKNRNKYLWLLLIIVHVTPTLATISRTAITLLILTTFLLTFFQLEFRGKMIFIVVFIFVSIFGFFFVKYISNENEYLSKYLERTSQAKEDERADLWEIGLNLSKGNLLTGIGFDRFYDYEWRKSVGLVYEVNDESAGIFTSEMLSIHNSFIDLILIGGIWLCISFISIILTIMNNAKTLIFYNDKKVNFIGALLLSLGINVLLFSITGQGATIKFTWFIFGIAFILYEEKILSLKLNNKLNNR